MVPALQFRGWQWVSLALATPVVVWGGWPFHRAALDQRRGTARPPWTPWSRWALAAYLWSLYALVFGDAGDGLHAAVAPGAAAPSTSRSRPG